MRAEEKGQQFTLCFFLLEKVVKNKFNGQPLIVGYQLPKHGPADSGTLLFSSRDAISRQKPPIADMMNITATSRIRKNNQGTVQGHDLMLTDHSPSPAYSGLPILVPNAGGSP